MDEENGEAAPNDLKDFKQANVLVTGGTGFIGRYLVDILLTLGAQVTIVDRTLGNPEITPSDHLSCHALTLPDSAITDLIANNAFGAVFHLAGPSSVAYSIRHPEEDLYNSADVTLHLLEVIRRYSPETRVVYMSSAAVYGNPDRLPVAEAAQLRPISPYGISKHTAESYVSLYAHLHGLRTAILRPFSIFGPGQKKLVVYDLIKKLSTNPNQVEVHGTGQEVRDFLHVKDVANASVMVMGNGTLTGEAYNVASGTGTAIKDIVDTLIRLMELSPCIRYTGKIRSGDPEKWVADISAIRSLGFKPMINIEEGLRQVVQWYDSI